MRGVVVLEGADGSGKTTLARRLVDRFGARYLHSVVRKDVWRYHLGALRLAARLSATQLVVLDRHWLSELVYGTVFRGGPAYDVGARCLDRALMRYGAATVLCVPGNLRAQVARHAERRALGAEAFASVERVATRYADLTLGNVAQPGDGYLDQLTRGELLPARQGTARYDLDRHTVEDGLDLALEALERARRYQEPAALDPRRRNLVGSLERARFLIVGEAVSPTYRLRNDPRWPFTWHDGLSAATWLNRALHSFGFDESLAVYTNADDPDDWLPVLASYDLVPVALGRVAERRLRAAGYVDVRALGHPQHARRFNHAGFDSYARQLQEALR